MSTKRMSDGREKPTQKTQKDAPDTAPANETPPGAQAPRSSSIPLGTQPPPNSARKNKKQKLEKPQVTLPDSKQPHQTVSRKEKCKKLSKLPPHASITKRPLHHPAIPSPFSSSDHPKVIYISHSTPFVPTLKRVRRLLLEASKRKSQSQTSQIPRNRQQRRNRKPLEPNGRLAPQDVEREIAEEGRAKGGGEAGEEVYVKATGRAIERALKIGVHFMGESDCKVRVETGSVMAVDDIEVRYDEGEKRLENSGKVEGESKNEDVPETRIRMVSSVTVAIVLR